MRPAIFVTERYINRMLQTKQWYRSSSCSLTTCKQTWTVRFIRKCSNTAVNAGVVDLINCPRMHGSWANRTVGVSLLAKNVRTNDVLWKFLCSLLCAECSKDIRRNDDDKRRNDMIWSFGSQFERGRALRIAKSAFTSWVWQGNTLDRNHTCIEPRSTMNKIRDLTKSRNTLLQFPIVVHIEPHSA